MSVDAIEYDLLFCVATRPDGTSEMRFFRNPQDVEGFFVRLNKNESEMLACALRLPGMHTVLRDDTARTLGVARVSAELQEAA